MANLELEREVAEHIVAACGWHTCDTCYEAHQEWRDVRYFMTVKRAKEILANAKKGGR
jgi:hypothetical protein